MDLLYNCIIRTKVSEKIWFNGECCKSILLYNAKYKLCKISCLMMTGSHVLSTDDTEYRTKNETISIGSQHFEKVGNLPTDVDLDGCSLMCDRKIFYNQKWDESIWF